MSKFTESVIEEAVLAWLEALGYRSATDWRSRGAQLLAPVKRKSP